MITSKLSETVWFQNLSSGKMFSYWILCVPQCQYQHNHLVGNIMKIFDWYHENSLSVWKFCINVMKTSSYCCFYVLLRQISHKVSHQIKYEHYIFLTATSSVTNNTFFRCVSIFSTFPGQSVSWLVGPSHSVTHTFRFSLCQRFWTVTEHS